MMNISYVTFMYGAGMPILFVIAFISFLIFYVLERLLIAYSFKQPPSFDYRINLSTIEILMFAPLLFLGNGFWMFSNQQIFSNDVNPKMTLASQFPTNHYISDVGSVVCS
jgi:hypothetical protein